MLCGSGLFPCFPPMRLFPNIQEEFRMIYDTKIFQGVSHMSLGYIFASTESHIHRLCPPGVAPRISANTGRMHVSIMGLKPFSSATSLTRDFYYEASNVLT